jgi:hypothetical protein
VSLRSGTLARASIAGLLVTGLLAACGGGDDDGDAGQQGTSTAPQTPLVIKVSGRKVDLAGIGTAKPLLADGIRRFGAPSEQEKVGDDACHLRWGDIGVFAIYANLGGEDPCGPTTGRLQGAALTNTRWRTAKGLAFGDPEAKLHELYPDAVANENRFTIASATRADGTREGLISVVIQDGKITSMQVYVGAAGD